MNIAPDNVDAPVMSVPISLTRADPEDENNVAVWGMVEYEVMTTIEAAPDAESSDMESVARATMLFNAEDFEAAGIASKVLAVAFEFEVKGERIVSESFPSLISTATTPLSPVSVAKADVEAMVAVGNVRAASPDVNMSSVAVIFAVSVKDTAVSPE